MTKHITGTRKEWLAARLELLEAEKELTRRSDELARRATLYVSRSCASSSLFSPFVGCPSCPSSLVPVSHTFGRRRGLLLPCQRAPPCDGRLLVMS